LFLLFLVYSVIGWVTEVIYCSIIEHKFVNRGFLFGPLCPVYGFGGLLVIYLLKPFSGNIFYLFTMAVLLTSTIEYLTGWALETIFSTKWWDYSTFRFNLHGRIWLVNSLLFGAMGVIAVRLVHPFLLGALSLIPSASQDLLSSSLAVVFSVDLAAPLKTLVKIDATLTALKEFTESLRERIDVREWFSEHDLRGSFERLRDLAPKDPTGTLARLAERFEQRMEKTRGMQRILRAFPAMKSASGLIPLDLFRFVRDFGTRALANQERADTTPTEFTESRNWAAGFNFYKLFWVFLVASFVGVVLEMVWCVFTRGHVESRSALVYGMLNPVYGAGALLMTVLLSRREKSRDIFIFAGSMLIGGVFEYLCSLAQEHVFGSVSWDYRNTQLNLDGRTNLMFALIWGVLGLVWVREVYAPLSRMIERIPARTGKILSVAILSVLLLDAGVSALAVQRWSARNRGVPERTVVDGVIDRQFPDTVLRRVYPNMQFTGGKTTSVPGSFAPAGSADPVYSVPPADTGLKR
jgi:uncharacterized membrane protein